MPNDYRQQITAAIDQIRKQSWFADGWTLRLTEPENGGSEWVGVQLSKKHWFNDDGMGIHFETWTGAKEIAAGKLPFVLHILHQSKFPGTDRSAAEFTRQWHAQTGPKKIIGRWPEYKIGRAKPLKGEVRFDTANATPVIVAEFGRLQLLGADIDRVLSKLLG
jgi:hypothetical protein